MFKVKIMKKILVIMAAGLGSRYGGIKQIARFGPDGEILMEYAIYDAVKAGFNKIVIIIKPEMLEDVKELFGNRIEICSGVEVCYAFQSNDIPCCGLGAPSGRTKPLGTVHAVLSARELIDGPFAVINADDYYGPRAMQLMLDELDKLERADMATMVAYPLKNTVSPYGSVTRGVCRVENGSLKKVDETYRITLCPDGLIRDMSTGEGRVLESECPVSMNMWGFHPGVLDMFADFFRGFMSGLDRDDNSSECLLPVAMDSFITDGKISVSVLTTDEQWFGVTYREDTPGVQRSLKLLHERGVYPAVLWSEK